MGKTTHISIGDKMEKIYKELAVRLWTNKFLYEDFDCSNGRYMIFSSLAEEEGCYIQFDDIDSLLCEIDRVIYGEYGWDQLEGDEEYYEDRMTLKKNLISKVELLLALA
jgi:hypothetical protein